MPTICKTVFQDDFVKNITWTGKTNSKNVKKLSLKKYEKIVGFIADLAFAADKTCTQKKCEENIIYKVFKYAYRNKKTKSGDIFDNDSRSTSSPIVSLQESTPITNDNSCEPSTVQGAKVPSASNSLISELDGNMNQTVHTKVAHPPSYGPPPPSSNGATIMNIPTQQPYQNPYSQNMSYYQPQFNQNQFVNPRPDGQPLGPNWTTNSFGHKWF